LHLFSGGDESRGASSGDLRLVCRQSVGPFNADCGSAPTIVVGFGAGYWFFSQFCSSNAGKRCVPRSTIRLGISGFSAYFILKYSFHLQPAKY
jgi:hypothetical protein